MKYKKYQQLNIPTAEPVRQKVLTQPNSCLSLREILERFANGDNSVLSHMPTDDFSDEMTDEEYFNDDDLSLPVIPADEIEAREYVISQEENSKRVLASMKKKQKEDESKFEKETKKEEEVENE